LFDRYPLREGKRGSENDVVAREKILEILPLLLHEDPQQRPSLDQVKELLWNDRLKSVTRKIMAKQ